MALNIDADALPHVQGDINRAPFQSGAFVEVYFERVPFSSFTDNNASTLQETARLLRSEGRLVIDTGSLAPVPALRAVLRVLGFRSIRVFRRGYLRITARLGE